jgi:two-component system NtrC family response regulator
MAQFLIIDDDRTLSGILTRLVTDMGHETRAAYSVKSGLSEASERQYDVVILDVNLPDGLGLDILPVIRNSAFPPEVIIMTGSADSDGAELAIKNGAWDYIQKPSSIKQLSLLLNRVLQFRAEKMKSVKSSASLQMDGFIGKGARMRDCLDLLFQAANSEANALLYGETGTGKEFFAHVIHQNSGRASQNFVIVDCASLSETLIGSALFGHEKGSFTGADKAHDGLIKQADHGTLFLDEIGELPLTMQKAFLRVIQERSFRPIGGKSEIKSNFRLIAATNRNLHQMVKQGEFREDLLFRLLSIYIELPPLRERAEDIKDLIMHHLSRICERYNIGVKGVSPDFFEVVMQYDWPGNVRELVNTIEKAIVAAGSGETLFSYHLPINLRIKVAQKNLNEPTPLPSIQIPEPAVQPPKIQGSLKDVRESVMTEIEKQYLKDLMVTTKGEINQACQISGLSRPRLYALLKKYNITRNLPDEGDSP